MFIRRYVRQRINMLVSLAMIATILDMNEIDCFVSVSKKIIYLAVYSNIATKLIITCCFHSNIIIFLGIFYEVLFGIGTVLLYNRSCGYWFIFIRPLFHLMNIYLYVVIHDYSKVDYDFQRIYTIHRIPIAQAIQYELTIIPDWRCCICLGDEGHPISLECNHLVHDDCIQEWLLVSSTCPICRSNVRLVQP